MTRLNFNFKLNTQKPDEKSLVATINQLKAERAYISAIRDGLRLVQDLRAGRLDTLLELYPWVSATLPASPAPVKAVGFKLPAPPASVLSLSVDNENKVIADDDQNLVVMTRSTSTDAGKNFLGSLASFGSMGK